MNCLETRANLSLHPIGLLSDREEGAVTEHLKACDSCRVHSEELAKAHAVLGKVNNGEDAALAAIWSGARAQIRSGEPLEPLFDEAPAPEPSILIALSCAYCRGALARVEARYCASCLTPHHGDCFREHGRCATFGCEETATVRPQVEAAATPASRFGRRLPRFLGILAIGLVGGSIAAWVNNRRMVANKAPRTAKYTQPAIVDTEALAPGATRARVLALFGTPDKEVEDPMAKGNLRLHYFQKGLRITVSPAGEVFGITYYGEPHSGKFDINGNDLGIYTKEDWYRGAAWRYQGLKVGDPVSMVMTKLGLADETISDINGGRSLFFKERRLWVHLSPGPEPKVVAYSLGGERPRNDINGNVDY